MTLVARLISLVGALIVGALVLGALLYVLDANEATWIVAAVMDVARFFAEPFRRIFVFDNNDLQVPVNFGIGAVVYGVLAALLASGARAIGVRTSGGSVVRAGRADTAR